ncbi:MAG: hypothetical protein M1828_006463 [Chrysothrix sp. TS-e1954]|nr:MAG: hypothetical protein M1828_006463 [Chrysothrix sp. TS-e1954]
MICRRIPRRLCCPSRSFSTKRPLRSYEDTIPNLKIGKDTRVIYQGFTGRVSTINAQQSLEWGTKVVGGTTPGKEGEHLGLPLLPSVRQAAEQLKPDATAVFVAAQHAAKAIEDAIAAEIPLIVAVAEFIPLHDMLRIAEMLKSQSKSRLVGANSPGIISPIGKCRVGFQPLICYKPGHIGLVAKSGTLSYEAVGALTRADMGQSLCIGMGGDIVAGTDLVDALTVFEHDAETEAIVLIGEVGGRAEQDAAQWIREYKKRALKPKPIVGVVGGLQAPPGRIMGHAGAFAAIGEDTAEVKHKALEKAGVRMVSHPTQFPTVLRDVMTNAGRDTGKLTNSAAQQSRGFHTLRRRPTPSNPHKTSSPAHARSLHLTQDQSKALLESYSIPCSAKERNEADKRYLAITVDRTQRCPAIVASPTAQRRQIWQRARVFPYPFSQGPTNEDIHHVFEHLHMDAAPPAAMATLGKIIRSLTTLYKEKEAISLAVHLSGTQDGNLTVERTEDFLFDSSALKSCGRQKPLHSTRDTSLMDPDELAAEPHGIVYIKLGLPDSHEHHEGEDRAIGTLINGAGLAMNAADALTSLGARPTNFLDTGGKATSDTIKRSFELLLADERAKVIFVNIFGGLTLCDMIAEGIIKAFKELGNGGGVAGRSGMCPVVVRLRGTNEEEGRKMIGESRLPLHAFDDFDEAARKCVELAEEEKRR